MWQMWEMWCRAWKPARLFHRLKTGSFCRSRGSRRPRRCGGCGSCRHHPPTEPRRVSWIGGWRAVSVDREGSDRSSRRRPSGPRGWPAWRTPRGRPPRWQTTAASSSGFPSATRTDSAEVGVVLQQQPKETHNTTKFFH